MEVSRFITFCYGCKPVGMLIICLRYRVKNVLRKDCNKIVLFFNAGIVFAKGLTMPLLGVNVRSLSNSFMIVELSL